MSISTSLWHYFFNRIFWFLLLPLTHPWAPWTWSCSMAPPSAPWGSAVPIRLSNRGKLMKTFLRREIQCLSCCCCCCCCWTSGGACSRSNFCGSLALSSCWLFFGRRRGFILAIFLPWDLISQSNDSSFPLSVLWRCVRMLKERLEWSWQLQKSLPSTTAVQKRGGVPQSISKVWRAFRGQFRGCARPHGGWSL